MTIFRDNFSPRRLPSCALTAAVFCVLLIAAPRGAHALTVVDLTDGGSQFVNISQKDLNLIKTSSDGVKVYTSGKAIDVKVADKDVFVQYLKDMAPLPQELFLVTSAGTYSLVLVPKQIPGETIVVRAPGEGIERAAKWEESNDYVMDLKDLIKGMYQGVAPMGYSITETGVDVTALQGTRQSETKLYKGATLVGEVSLLANLTKTPIELAENQFYKKGVLAVSIDHRQVPPMGQIKVYIVRRSSSAGELGASQSLNPLNVIRSRQ